MEQVRQLPRSASVCWLRRCGPPEFVDCRPEVSLRYHVHGEFATGTRVLWIYSECFIEKLAGG